MKQVTQEEMRQLLLQEGDDIEKIKKQYMKLSLQYHPDKWAQEALEVQNIAKENFQNINEVYNAILKEILKENPENTDLKTQMLAREVYDNIPFFAMFHHHTNQEGLVSKGSQASRFEIVYDGLDESLERLCRDRIHIIIEKINQFSTPNKSGDGSTGPEFAWITRQNIPKKDNITSRTRDWVSHMSYIIPLSNKCQTALNVLRLVEYHKNHSRSFEKFAEAVDSLKKNIGLTRFENVVEKANAIQFYNIVIEFSELQSFKEVARQLSKEDFIQIMCNVTSLTQDAVISTQLKKYLGIKLDDKPALQVFIDKRDNIHQLRECDMFFYGNDHDKFTLKLLELLVDDVIALKGDQFVDKQLLLISVGWICKRPLFGVRDYTATMNLRDIQGVDDLMRRLSDFIRSGDNDGFNDRARFAIAYYVYSASINDIDSTYDQAMIKLDLTRNQSLDPDHQAEYTSAIVVRQDRKKSPKPDSVYKRSALTWSQIYHRMNGYSIALSGFGYSSIAMVKMILPYWKKCTWSTANALENSMNELRELAIKGADQEIDLEDIKRAAEIKLAIQDISASLQDCIDTMKSINRLYFLCCLIAVCVLLRNVYVVSSSMYNNFDKNKFKPTHIITEPCKAIIDLTTLTLLGNQYFYNKDERFILCDMYAKSKEFVYDHYKLIGATGCALALVGAYHKGYIDMSALNNYFADKSVPMPDMAR